MKRILLAAMILCGLFSAAEARHRRVVAHPECNVTMPCEGVETSKRGERVVRAMGGFGTATKVYRQRHAARHPVRHREPAVRRHRPAPVERAIVRQEQPQQLAARPAFAGVDYIAVKDGIGPKPRKWCGWFMQHDTGVTSKATGLNLNMAREWARVGQATVASIGAIVVWRHHVGKIVGKAANGQWIVRSGNDGNRLRERPLSVASAIAFRSL